jgi:hypothetical protein
VHVIFSYINLWVDTTTFYEYWTSSLEILCCSNTIWWGIRLLYSINDLKLFGSK